MFTPVTSNKHITGDLMSEIKSEKDSQALSTSAFSSACIRRSFSASRKKCSLK